MRALALLGMTAILASCTGETTVIREVQVTASTEATQITAPPPADEPVRLSRDRAIATARDSAPGLYAYTDDEIISMMMTSCEAIDSWAPDYEGYLQQARQVIQHDVADLQQEITAIIVASIFSLCTEHQTGISDALDRGNSGY